jgi:predicted dehydrogenase
LKGNIVLNKTSTTLLLLVLTFMACKDNKVTTGKTAAEIGEVKLMTLDPGHFHAALVQKTMYPQVSPDVYVYAPEGSDVVDHLKLIDGYNRRSKNPTTWRQHIYRGDDFLKKMLEEKPGNVVVIAGNNRRKTEYIKAAVNAGINVLADKPMCINQEGFELLKQSFASAQENGVLLYDIMTERYEITTVLQKVLAHRPDVFGELIQGTPEKPAITKESVHHFFKYVSGSPIKRPAWFFDVKQQGEGIVDVSTHLVDLVQWECFPEQIIDYGKDVQLISARRWATALTLEQFKQVTQLPEYPDYLLPYVQDDKLNVYSNGEFIYRIKGIYAKVLVIWNFEAPPGAGDTHFSIMRGSKADIIIQQGKEQNYRPELYLQAVGDHSTLARTLTPAVEQLAVDYPGLSLKKNGGAWHIIIPPAYRDGHEAHFGKVMEKFLSFLKDGKMPDWETPNMIAKYYTTTAALEMALSSEHAR